MAISGNTQTARQSASSKHLFCRRNSLPSSFTSHLAALCTGLFHESRDGWSEGLVWLTAAWKDEEAWFIDEDEEK
jgi:hypothetical protein